MIETVLLLAAAVTDLSRQLAPDLPAFSHALGSRK
jgi:hypothetical protein